jgi:hypothetical protein
MFGLIAIVLMLTFAPSSFAQISIQLFNTPSPGEIQTNRNIQTADPTSLGAGLLVSGSIIANSILTTTNLTLTFPAPITSSPTAVNGAFAGGLVPAVSVPDEDPLRIEGQSGVFAGITAVGTVNYSAGTITMTLPGFGLAQNTESGSFRIVGVKVDANGKTAPLMVSASLSSTANNYILTGSTANLVSALDTGFTLSQGTVSGQTNAGTMLIFTNQSTPFFADPTASILIEEKFASAWRSPTQASTSGVALPNGTNLRLTVTGIPSGVTIGFSQILVGSSTPGVALSNPDLTNVGSDNQTTFSFTGNPSLSSIQRIAFTLTLSGTPTGLAAGTIVATVTHAPIGDALDSDPITGVPTEEGGYPRFAQADQIVTIGNIVAANTTLLVPYAVVDGPYDTGIALANTTADPFGTGSGGATPVAGTVNVTVFPRTATGAGTAVSRTTSSTFGPGVGLAADGTLAAGGTWTFNLREFLTAAGQTGSFAGYIFLQTNFLNAHGITFIYNGTGFTSFSPMLVLAPPQSVSRNTVTVESLGF